MGHVIEFSGVSKRYVLQRRPARDAREALAGLFRRRPAREEFWALKGASFEVEPGEALGIIGPNGAGKSTILKILSRITRPTGGRVEVKGRLSALIEVGAGFHPDLTGRENVYLNGSILGLTRREIDARFERIVEFAEVAQFIDVPVKRCSSGMQLRLGFAVAAQVEPDILLVDEALAVGDMAFQRKCLRAIQELRQAGTSIVLVSHSMEAVSSLCSRVLFLQHGEVTGVGKPDRIIAQYREHVFGRNGTAPRRAAPRGQPVEIESVAIEDEAGGERRVFGTGETIVIRAAFRCREPVPDAIFYVGISRPDGLLCFGTDTFVESDRVLGIAGQGTVRVAFRDVQLLAGSYLVSVRVGSRNKYVYFDRHDLAYGLVIDNSKPGWGVMYLPHRWTLEQADSSEEWSSGGESVGVPEPEARIRNGRG